MSDTKQRLHAALRAFAQQQERCVLAVLRTAPDDPKYEQTIRYHRGMVDGALAAVVDEIMHIITTGE